MATEGSNDVRQSSQATVAAIARLDRPSQSLLPGSRVDVEIILAQRNNVIALEPSVIQQLETKPFVWIQDPQGRLQKRFIKLGLEGSTKVEVIEGISENDKIVVPVNNAVFESGLIVRYLATKS